MAIVLSWPGVLAVFSRWAISYGIVNEVPGPFCMHEWMLRQGKEVNIKSSFNILHILFKYDIFVRMQPYTYVYVWKNTLTRVFGYELRNEIVYIDRNRHR